MRVYQSVVVVCQSGSFMDLHAWLPMCRRVPLSRFLFRRLHPGGIIIIKTIQRRQGWTDAHIQQSLSCPRAAKNGPEEKSVYRCNIHQGHKAFLVSPAADSAAMSREESVMPGVLEPSILVKPRDPGRTRCDTSSVV